jgi:Family of unknown function (DUF5641)
MVLNEVEIRLPQSFYQTKPESVKEEIKVVYVEILEEEMLKRHDWPTGVVKQVILGRDVIGQVAVVKTTNGSQNCVV